MERSNKQNSMLKAMFLSVAIHVLCLAGVMYFVTPAAHCPETVQVLSATLDPPGGGGDIRSTKAAAKMPDDPAQNTQRPSRQPRRLQLPVALEKAPVEQETHDPQNVNKAFVDQIASLNAGNHEPGKDAAIPLLSHAGGDGVGKGIGTGMGGGEGSGVGNHTGPGQGNESLNRYLRENFAYIRAMILKHITYPPVARKNGWQGKVLVLFIIMEDGYVRGLKIVESSGYGVLDGNVMETIRDVQPFPKPPVRAEIVIPINYVLKS